MDMQFNRLLEQVTTFMEKEARTETIVGKPFKLGEYDCIPVVRLGMGFGTGGGEGDAPKAGHGEGVGAGAGMGLEPIGFLVARGEEITFVSTKTNRGLAAAFEKVPDLLNKFMDMQKETTTEPELVS